MFKVGHEPSRNSFLVAKMLQNFVFLAVLVAGDVAVEARKGLPVEGISSPTESSNRAERFLSQSPEDPDLGTAAWPDDPQRQILVVVWNLSFIPATLVGFLVCLALEKSRPAPLTWKVEPFEWDQNEEDRTKEGKKASQELAIFFFFCLLVLAPVAWFTWEDPTVALGWSWGVTLAALSGLFACDYFQIRFLDCLGFREDQRCGKSLPAFLLLSGLLASTEPWSWLGELSTESSLLAVAKPGACLPAALFGAKLLHPLARSILAPEKWVGWNIRWGLRSFGALLGVWLVSLMALAGTLWKDDWLVAMSWSVGIWLASLAGLALAAHRHDARWPDEVCMMLASLSMAHIEDEKLGGMLDNALYTSLLPMGGEGLLLAAALLGSGLLLTGDFLPWILQFYRAPRTVVDMSKDDLMAGHVWGSVNVTVNDWAGSPPGELLPTASELAHHPHLAEVRSLYWLLAIVGHFAVTACLGTLIMVAPLPSRLGRLLGPGEDQPDVNGATFAPSKSASPSVFFATLGHLAVVTKLGLLSVSLGAISVSNGFDWEVWQSIADYGCLWLLVQAATTRLAYPEVRYKVSSFGLAMVSGLIPFLSDTFDSSKDVMFPCVCLSQPSIWTQGIGGILLVHLFAWHLHMLFDEPLRFELQKSYLSVFFAPQPGSAVVPHGDLFTVINGPASDDGNDNNDEEVGPGEGNEELEAPLLGETAATATTAESKFQLPAAFWVKLFEQSVPERRRAILGEDGPQALGVIVFLALTSRFPVASILLSVSIPAARVAFSLIFYQRLRRREAVQAFLTAKLFEGARAGNTALHEFGMRHLLNMKPEMAQFGEATQLKKGQFVSLALCYCQNDLSVPDILALSSLEECKIGGGNFDDPSCVAMGEVLASPASKLKMLELETQCEEMTTLFTGLGKALQTNKSLQTLVLRDLLTGTADLAAVDELTEALASESATALRSLTLSMKFEDASSTLRCFAKALRANKTLEKLHLADRDASEVDIESLDVFAEALATSTTFKTLYLDACFEDLHAAFCGFGKVLRESQQLETLVIRDGSMSCSDSVTEFAQALGAARAIKSLTINVNLKDGSGAFRDFGEALRSNKSLKELRLLGGFPSKWAPDDAAVEAFAKAIGDSSTLEKCDLGRLVVISEAGKEELEKAASLRDDCGNPCEIRFDVDQDEED